MTTAAAVFAVVLVVVRTVVAIHKQRSSEELAGYLHDGTVPSREEAAPCAGDGRNVEALAVAPSKKATVAGDNSDRRGLAHLISEGSSTGRRQTFRNHRSSHEGGGGTVWSQGGATMR
ncbi:hypothetical protein NL676_007373 [Syzygium grande]|nr:hypothetical protein NL676_007373 [Syzygium grande]